jgi:hypothetical protein
MEVDTGFEDVIAGEVYAHPDIPSVAVPVTATVNQQEQPCAASSGTVAAPSIETSTESSATTLTAPGLTPAAVQAAKALVQLPQLTWPELSKLAREIAMDIKERVVILQEFKLNDTQYDFLEANNDFYRSALAAACKEWHAPLSTAERIKVEAAAILEDSLLGLGARMQNKGEGLPGVIEAAKLFAKVAGVGERESSQSAPGERFSINIDLGGDQKISVSSSPMPLSAPAGAGLRTLPPHEETS